jgi:hypothetical protein
MGEYAQCINPMQVVQPDRANPKCPRTHRSADREAVAAEAAGKRDAWRLMYLPQAVAGSSLSAISRAVRRRV